MKIPSIFYGKAGQVPARIRKLAKSLIQTHEFSSYDPGPLLDTREVSGLVLISEEFGRSVDHHFHCYMLSQALVELSPRGGARKILHDWLVGSLDEEWRFMCTLGGVSANGLDRGDPVFARRYIEAAIDHWPAMAAERYRFGPVFEGEDILHHWLTLFSALEILGLSSRERMRVAGREPHVLLDLVDKRGALS